MPSIGISEEVTVSVKQAAEQQGHNVRKSIPTSRLSPADITAHTAANLYALMAWLYDKPKN